MALIIFDRTLKKKKKKKKNRYMLAFCIIQSLKKEVYKFIYAFLNYKFNTWLKSSNVKTIPKEYQMLFKSLKTQKSDEQ